MAEDTLHNQLTSLNRLVTWIREQLRRCDSAWLLFAVIVLGVLLVKPNVLFPVLSDTLGNLLHTSIFITFAVLLLAWLRATGAEALVGKAFQGNEITMVVLAAFVGGVAPFCSCEVVPFIAALLAMGTPLSAIMAFWLSSPMIDPPMFLITASALGFEFAIAKTVAAVGFGLVGGISMMLLSRTGLLNDPLKQVSVGCCNSSCGSTSAMTQNVEWAFWKSKARVGTFIEAASSNALFLLKWLALAYLIQSLMVRYVPAEWIASGLGGEGLQPIALGALLGGPAYLNGYAAVPLVQGLVQQGMSQGAAMSFILAGSVTCIPAAIAVWALVKPRIFFAYVGLGLFCSFVAGVIWSIVVTAIG